MPTLNNNGVSIYYETHGSGPVLLLSHGFSATSAMWQGQVEPLSRNHTLVLWDMRGHGQSDYPADPAAYSEDATVSDMAAILDALGAPTAIIGGLSLGGYMSLAFHLRYPERFDAEGLAPLQKGTAERSKSRHRDATGLAHAARGMLTQRDSGVIHSLPDIKVPALVLVGSRDTPFLAATDYMAAKISGSTKVVIPDAGHAANIDQPEAFNTAVLAFLATLN